MLVVICLLCFARSDTEFVVNNMTYTNDDQHNKNANADELNDFEST